MAQYSLSWHSYSEDLRNTLGDLFSSENFSDVTLVCDGMKKIKAHKNILWACSPVLKDILELDLSNNAIIYLRGVRHSIMESIIQFIYLGEVSLKEDDINELLFVAKDLKIRQLNETKVNDDFTAKIFDKEEEAFGRNPIDIPIKEEISLDNSDQSDQLQDSKPDIKVLEKNDGTQSVKSFQCPNCHYQSNKLSNVKQHIKSLHERIKYPCNQCDKKLHSPSGLRLHLKGVHGVL